MAARDRYEGVARHLISGTTGPWRAQRFDCMDKAVESAGGRRCFAAKVCDRIIGRGGVKPSRLIAAGPKPPES
jgi:hypothetical protein